MSAIPNNIQCPVSECNFTVVASDKNKDSFIDYCIKTLDRLNQNESIHIVLQCHHLQYNKNSKSVLILEMAECYDDKFLQNISKDNKISVNIQNGWILIFPFQNDIISRLNSIFTHQHISLIYLDINIDIPFLMMEGVKFNFGNIIDIPTKRKSIINELQLPENCVETEKIKEKKQQVLNMPKLDLILFSSDNLNYELLNNFDFWKITVVDLVMISLHLVSCVQLQTFENVKQTSSEKVTAFLDIQKEYGILAPYLKKKFTYNKIPKNEALIKTQAFSIYTFSKLILDNYILYITFVPQDKKMEKSDIEKIFNYVSNILKYSNINNIIPKINKYIKNSTNAKLTQIWSSLKPIFEDDKNQKIFDNEVDQLILQSFQNFNAYLELESDEQAKQKTKIDFNFNLVLNAISCYFNFQLNEKSKVNSKKLETIFFKQIFNPNAESKYITDIFPFYNVHDKLIYNNDSSVYINSLKRNENAQLISFFYSILSIQEDLKIPFTIIFTRLNLAIYDLKTKVDKYVNIVSEFDLICKEYVDFKSSKKCDKPCICFLHPEDILQLLFNLRNDGIDIFPITRFCFADMDHRTATTDAFYSILSTKIDEMTKKKKNFPLQALLISENSNTSVKSCFDNIVTVELPKRNMFFNLKNFPVKENKKFVDHKKHVKSEVVKSTLELIKEMAKNPEDVGNILIFSTEDNRINEIESNLNEKLPTCSSSDCDVIVIQNSIINAIKKREELDKVINNEISKSKKNKKANKLIVLLLKATGSLSDEKKTIINEPIKKYPNLIKVVISPSILPEKISIQGLSVVVDCGLFAKSCRDENDVICKSEEVISAQVQSHRKSLLGQTKPGVFVPIIIKGNAPKSESETSDLDINFKDLLTIRKYGCKIEELKKLPNKLSESVVSELIPKLVEINALTKDNHNLTPYGEFLSFLCSKLPICRSIASVSNYNFNEFQFPKLIDNYTDNDLRACLGYMIYRLIIDPDLFKNQSIEKYKKYFDKRSDIVSILRTFIDMSQVGSKDITIKAKSKFGFDGEKALHVYNKVTNLAKNMFVFNKSDLKEKKNAGIIDINDDTEEKVNVEKEERGEKIIEDEKIIESTENDNDLEENDNDNSEDDSANDDDDDEENDMKFVDSNQNLTKENNNNNNDNRILEDEIDSKNKENYRLFFGLLKKYTDKLASEDKLYSFIQELIDEFQKYNPDFIKCREIEFDNIEQLRSDPTYIFKANKSLAFQKGKEVFISSNMRFGATEFDCPSNCLLMTIVHDECMQSNKGYFIHCNPKYEPKSFMKHPITIEVLNKMNLFEFLISCYIDNDYSHFSKFYSGPKNKNQEDNILFYKTAKKVGEKKTSDLISFIPNDETAFNAIVKAQLLINYTPSTLLIYQAQLKCFIKLHTIGSDNFESSVHFFKDNEFYAYSFNRQTIDFLSQNIEQLKTNNEAFSIAFTTQNVDESSYRPMNPQANKNYVFNDKGTNENHLILLSSSKIDSLESLPWLNNIDKMSLEIADDDLILYAANALNKDIISISKFSTRLIFTSSDSTLKIKGDVPQLETQLPPSIEGEISKLIYSCESKYIHGNEIASKIEFDGFSYNGKPFPQIPEINKIPKAKPFNLGKSCVCVDVEDIKEVEKVKEKVLNILSSKGIDATVQSLQLYKIIIHHKSLLKLSKDEFINRINNVVSQFGGICVYNKPKYYDVNNKHYKGCIHVVMYSSYFTLPFSAMVMKAFNIKKTSQHIIIPDNIVDEFLAKNPLVINIIKACFGPNAFKVIKKSKNLVGDNSIMSHFLAHFRTNLSAVEDDNDNSSYDGKTFGLVMTLKKNDYNDGKKVDLNKKPTGKEIKFALTLVKDKQPYLNAAGLKLSIEKANIKNDIFQQFVFGTGEYNTVIDSVQQRGMVWDVANEEDADPPEGTPFYLFLFHGRHNQRFIYYNNMIMAKQNGQVATFVGGDEPFVMMKPCEKLKARQTFKIQLL